ncbi:GMC family oxidoreductase [soil metagenome]
MLLPADENPPDDILSADVCIIGAGPAGMALARRLRKEALRLCILESGDLFPDDLSQKLNEGVIETPHSVRNYSTTSSRLRGVGGTANAWNVQLTADEPPRLARFAPLDESDFARRPWVAGSGWPWGKADLDPHYEVAQSLCGLGPFEYSPTPWKDDRHRPLGLGDRIRTSVFQLGDREVWTDAGPRELGQARNVTLCPRATVTDLETNEAHTTVTGCLAARPGERGLRVSARVFVLACGGIENARVLLSSANSERRALGNGSGLVGRFFMEHPIVRMGDLWPARRGAFEEAGLYDLRRVRGTAIMGHLSLTDEALRREEILSVGMVLVPRPRPRVPGALRSLKEFAAVRRERLPGKPAAQVRSIVTGASGTALYAYDRFVKDAYFHSMNRGGWARREGNASRYRLWQVFGGIEQAPDASNRVSLGNERDDLGQRQVRLQWGWREAELETLRRAQSILEEDCTRTSFGRFVASRFDGEPPPLHGAHHHLGTTRMDADPARGVVDADCGVHGVGNLYLAGASVFPTSGYVNPTLTVVALAVRLADHIAQELRPPTLPPARQRDANA